MEGLFVFCCNYLEATFHLMFDKFQLFSCIQLFTPFFPRYCVLEIKFVSFTIATSILSFFSKTSPNLLPVSSLSSYYFHVSVFSWYYLFIIFLNNMLSSCVFNFLMLSLSPFWKIGFIRKGNQTGPVMIFKYGHNRTYIFLNFPTYLNSETQPALSLPVQQRRLLYTRQEGTTYIKYPIVKCGTSSRGKQMFHVRLLVDASQ